MQTGKVLQRLGPTRTADDLLAFVDIVADHDRDAKKGVVIWDNLNIHHEGSAQRWTAFQERHVQRCAFHHTPIHASWVNEVDEFGFLRLPWSYSRLRLQERTSGIRY